MVEENTQQLIRVFTQMPMSAYYMSHLIHAASHIIRGRNGNREPLPHGEQTAPQLNQQNKPLRTVTAPSQQLDALRKELRTYGVDFAIIPREQGAEVLFKAQDVQQIAAAWKAVVKTQFPKEEILGQVQHTQEAAAGQAAQTENTAQEAAAGQAAQTESTAQEAAAGQDPRTENTAQEATAGQETQRESTLQETAEAQAVPKLSEQLAHAQETAAARNAAHTTSKAKELTPPIQEVQPL